MPPSVVRHFTTEERSLHLPAVGELVAVTLDCPDPAHLADFYKEALGLEVLYSDESAAYVGNSSGNGMRLGFQTVDNYQKPEWPTRSAPQQVHLDIEVTDLDRAQTRLTELGAAPAPTQPAPDNWRVILDPAGHPFCITLSS